MRHVLETLAVPSCTRWTSAIDATQTRLGAGSSCSEPIRAAVQRAALRIVISLLAWLSCFLALGATARAATQACTPSFVPTFGGEPGVSEIVRAMCEFDDGTGNALYIGGDFQSAGGFATSRIAKWNGSTCGALGSGLNGRVRALCVFNDGTGDALYAAGEFTTAGGTAATRIAKWNGTSWSALGSGLNGTVHALAVYTDANGPALYVGGEFTTAGGIAARSIARWRNNSWSALQSGITGKVYSLATYDDGGGDALYVGGQFTAAGPVATSGVARWNGTAWSAITNTLSSTTYIFSMVTYDVGTGPRLYFAGLNDFSSPFSTLSIALVRDWDGVTFGTPFSLPQLSGVSTGIYALDVFDSGSGPELYLTGSFTSPTGHIARWKGGALSSLGTGLSAGVSATFGASLGVFDDGSGAKLHVGGAFRAAGPTGSHQFARWSGTSWSSIGTGLNEFVFDAATFDSGSGPEIYAGGNFTHAGVTAVPYLARWTGTQWASVGTGPNLFVSEVESVDVGGGPRLYVGGYFTSAGGVPVSYIASWDGSSWSAVGGGVNSNVTALYGHDDGSGTALHVGGYFSSAGGTANTRGVARWNGASWSGLGTGIQGSSGNVETMVTYDDGSGPALFVAGSFSNVGGVPAANIAKWNGTSWSALGAGLSASASSLAAFDDGGGPALYVGGSFQMAGGQSRPWLARWRNGAWSAPIPAINSAVASLAVHDDGTGPALFLGGNFTTIGGTPFARLARWNGTNLSALGSGVIGELGQVNALAVHRDMYGSSLIVAGLFNSAPNSGDSFIARWGCPIQVAGTSYCTAGTSSQGCVASLAGNGVPSATSSSGHSIVASNLPGQQSALIFYGVSGPVSTPWGAGSSFLCVKSPTERTPTATVGGTGGACDGTLSIDWNAYRATHPTSVGQPFSPGDQVWAQAWYRDPPAPKTTSLSNALTFFVTP